MSATFYPAEWLTAALSVGGAKDAFKIISTDTSYDTARCVQTVKVLHKDTGAVWSFACVVEREGV